MFFNQYPYINVNDLNIDYLIMKLKALEAQLSNFIKINTIKYANPIQWNITTQYEANTVVIDANDGTAYLSVAPVPSGIALTNTDYWTPIFTLNLLSANQNITMRDDSANVLATFASAENDWLIWNATLYKVTRPIAVNEAYVVGYNLTRYSVELFIKDYISALMIIIGDLNDLLTTDKDSVVNAINELYNAIAALSAIKIVFADVSELIDGDLSDGDIVFVNGYYSSEDGGASKYVITTTPNTFTIALNNGLYAMPETERPTPEIFGAYCDGVNDDAPAITKAVDYVLYKNPIHDTAVFERGFGGGTVYFNAKSYYVKSTINMLGWGHIKLAGCPSLATDIYVDSQFGVVDYSTTASKAELKTKIPWYLTIEDIDFIKTTNNSTAIIDIDQPYNVRIKNCRFMNSNGGSPIYGVGIKISTIVDFMAENCCFYGLHRGVLIEPYSGTYPVDFTGTNHNTTTTFANCTIAICDCGVYAVFNQEGYVHSLQFENCILEANDVGVISSCDMTSKPTQVNFHYCYFERNTTDAIELQNSCLVFDESNWLARSNDSDTRNRIYMLQQTSLGANTAVKNYIVLNKDSDIRTTNNVASKFFYDYNPTFLKSPIRTIDTYNNCLEVKGAEIYAPTYINASTHTKVVAEVKNGHTYYVGKGDIVASPNTYTAVQSDTNVTVSGSGTLKVVDQSDALYKFTW